MGRYWKALEWMGKNGKGQAEMRRDVKGWDGKRLEGIEWEGMGWGGKALEWGNERNWEGL